MRVALSNSEDLIKYFLVFLHLSNASHHIQSHTYCLYVNVQKLLARFIYLFFIFIFFLPVENQSLGKISCTHKSSRPGNYYQQLEISCFFTVFHTFVSRLITVHESIIGDMAVLQLIIIFFDASILQLLSGNTFIHLTGICIRVLLESRCAEMPVPSYGYIWQQ